jgi:hypothetical protein
MRVPCDNLARGVLRTSTSGKVFDIPDDNIAVCISGEKDRVGFIRRKRGNGLQMLIYNLYNNPLSTEKCA